MNILLAALSIFFLRLLDQTLGTLRVLYVNKGKPVFGAVLGFIESAIWVVAISRVIQDLNDPLLIFGYALGFASGTATLHFFGVGIGSIAIKTKFSSIVLRIAGFGCALFGISLLI